MYTLKALRQPVWNKSSIWKYALRWKRFVDCNCKEIVIDMFLEISSPYEHVFATLLEKQKNNFSNYVFAAILKF